MNLSLVENQQQDTVIAALPIWALSKASTQQLEVRNDIKTTKSSDKSLAILDWYASAHTTSS